MPKLLQRIIIAHPHKNQRKSEKVANEKLLCLAYQCINNALMHQTTFAYISLYLHMYAVHVGDAYLIGGLNINVNL